MPDPVKPFDRRKPFKRIHNDDAIPKDSPDGLGKSCGCHTPEEFENFEEEFLKVMEESTHPAFALMVKLIRAAKEAAAALATTTAILSIAMAILSAFGGPVGILSAIKDIATVIAAISAVISTVLDVIDTVLRKFFARLAARVLPRAMRVIPQWVTVRKGQSNAAVANDQVVEVEGMAARSYGNPVDVPFWQWHRWFNWNIHVQPESAYRNVMSQASNSRSRTGVAAGEAPFAEDGTIEVQWDTGALWKSQAAFESGAPSGPAALRSWIEENDGPMMAADWCWPMTGMFVWAAGRWVYDCSRSTVEKNARMATMLNPCKAIATARWRAVKFVENDFSVPAIQFMFFACKRGGYIDHGTLSDRDYEFIVDLPPLDPGDTPPFPIGSTVQDIHHNTIVVRPRLLKRVDNPFSNANAATIIPTVEVIRPEDPRKPPAQVKIKIPLSAAGNAAAAGCILSLGWFDPALEQANKLRRCKLTINEFHGRLTVRDSGLKKIRDFFKQEDADLQKDIAEAFLKLKILGIPVGEIISKVPGLNNLVTAMINAALTKFLDALQEIAPLESEEWLVRFGFHGEWRSLYFHNMKTGPIAFKASAEEDDDPNSPKEKALIFETFIREGDPLFFSVSGMEFDPVGDMMHAAHKDRFIHLNDAEVPWPGIVNPDPDPAEAKKKFRAMVFQYVLRCMIDMTMGRPALGLDNSPLGLLEGASPNSDEPLTVRAANAGSRTINKTARFARAAGDQMILVHASGDDYRVTYTLEIEPVKL